MSVISSFWCWSVLLVCLSRSVFTRAQELGRIYPSYVTFYTAPALTRTIWHDRKTEIFENFINKLKPIQEELSAAVVLSGVSEGTLVTGTLRLTQKQPPNGVVVIEGVIKNLDFGLHGFHIHELGDIRGGCAASGGHYNPYSRSHGSPTDKNRHIGDLGNIMANSRGDAVVSIRDTVITLSGLRSVVGRAFVVHKDEDDLGRGGDVGSGTTGNAGKRVGCGVIVIK